MELGMRRALHCVSLSCMLLFAEAASANTELPGALDGDGDFRRA